MSEDLEMYKEKYIEGLSRSMGAPKEVLERSSVVKSWIRAMGEFLKDKIA